MTIDGKSTVFGMFVGVVSTVVLAGGVGWFLMMKINSARTTERAEFRTIIERQNTQIQQLQTALISEQQRQQSQQPQDSSVQLLNAIHPGLGTAAAVVDKAIKADQAKRAAVAAQQTATIVTALPPAGTCGANDILINNQCTTCNTGLHPGTFPDGSAGCVR